MAMKRNGKSPVSSDTDEIFMFFKDVSLGPHENQLRFRLIHFWEARNPVKKKLIGLEMLLIDEQGTVIQGFISPGRIKKYLPDLKQGSVYTLKNFYGSRNKTMYRVADHIATVSFTWNSELSVLYEIPTSFDEDRFRFHSYEDFEANCDLKGDLYDVVGHMKLVNGQTLIERPTLDEVKIDTTRHIMVHVQSHDGPVMKLYLWDQAAADFCKKFNSYDNTPTVLLVTAVNTKRLGGTLALTSMSPTRVFMDYDVQPTIDYFNWLGSNPEIAMQVSADVVTKRETLTIADIFTYMKQESAKLGTILHAVDAMLRLPKVQHLWYRAKISVYDNSDQAVFVLLGDAGRVLTGDVRSFQGS
uniref:Replication protein A 70 kDa DNA-binding subunit B/D first OB fold domain-containing protein n=1 Tax=Brassica campestris TaxID=3711 RepID=M4D656_BRACM